MRVHGIAWLVLGCLVAGRPVIASAEDGPARSVTLILDCSRSMAAKVAGEPGVLEVSDEPESSRLDAARDALKATLTRLSQDGRPLVAVWLFGHRLAWEEKDEPALVEQTKYLEQSSGFGALGSLLPGDDVELVRPLARLEPRDLAPTFARLDALVPWGEDPLWLAITKAMDSLGRDAAAESSIVVITDGGNRQWIARHQTTKDDVLEAADRRPAPVHIVAFGSPVTGQAQADFRQIAARTGGSFHQADTAAQLALRLEEAIEGAASGGPSRPAAGNLVKPVAAGANLQPATSRTISGRVTFYGQPVRKARVMLEPGDLAAVTTDARGRFTLENVTPGTYKITSEGVVKNVIRSHRRQLTIDPGAPGDEPLAIEIVLE